METKIIQKYCGQCGNSVNLETDKYCGKCGQRLFATLKELMMEAIQDYNEWDLNRNRKGNDKKKRIEKKLKYRKR